MKSKQFSKCELQNGRNCALKCRENLHVMKRYAMISCHEDFLLHAPFSVEYLTRLEFPFLAKNMIGRRWLLELVLASNANGKCLRGDSIVFNTASSG